MELKAQNNQLVMASFHLGREESSITETLGLVCTIDGRNADKTD